MSVVVGFLYMLSLIHIYSAASMVLLSVLYKQPVCKQKSMVTKEIISEYKICEFLYCWIILDTGMQPFNYWDNPSQVVQHPGCLAILEKKSLFLYLLYSLMFWYVFFYFIIASLQTVAIVLCRTILFSICGHLHYSKFLRIALGL